MTRISSTSLDILDLEKIFIESKIYYFIYIGNIRNGTKIEKGEKLMSKLKTEMKDLVQLKNNHLYFQSYVFTVKSKDKIHVITPRLWPVGINVREFIEI